MGDIFSGMGESGGASERAVGCGQSGGKRARLVKGSPEAKAYMASIRKKKGRGMSGGGMSGGDFWDDLGNIASAAAPFIEMMI